MEFCVAESRAAKRIGLRMDRNETIQWLDRCMAGGVEKVLQFRKGSDKAIELSQEIYFFAAERTWLADGMPYYNVWPKVVEPLSRIDLSSVMGGSFHQPLEALCIRFAKGYEMPGFDDNHPLQYAIFHRGVPSRSDIPEVAMNLYSDCHESNGVMEFFHDRSVEDSVVRGQALPCSLHKLLRLYVSVCLIAAGKDEQIITPDVLSKDRSRFDESRDTAIVERAVRRGKIGWDIGREIHCSPHWRRPHAALYHVGKGRTEHRIVFRKGALVKRDDITKVPTGYLADEKF